MLPVPAFPAFPHAITLPALSMTILSARTVLSRASSTYKSRGPNKGAIAGDVIAAIAIVAIAAFAFYYLRGRGRRAPSPGFIIDPASNEAGVQRVMNAQLQTNKEFVKGPSDRGALDLSTMPVLPTSPMKVYVRVFSCLRCVRACSFFSWALRIRIPQQRCPSPKTISIPGASLPGQHMDNAKAPKT